MLKENAQLDLQIINLKSQKAELNNLFKYLKSGAEFSDFSPNFEALKDQVFQHAFQQIQNLEDQRKDLLLKYVAESEEVISIEEKIANLKTFVNETVQNTVKQLAIREQTIQHEVDQIDQKLSTFPTRAMDLESYEREVAHNEQMYKQLIEKRTELEIANASDVSFHQVIDYATQPKNTVWPNVPMIYGLIIMFCLIVGTVLSYILYYLFATIKSLSTLKDLSALPILATVFKRKKNQKERDSEFNNIAANLQIWCSKNHDAMKQDGKVIIVSSYASGEGKTFVSKGIAETFSKSGKKVLIVDMDVRRPDLHNHFQTDVAPGVVDLIEKNQKVGIIREVNEYLDFISAGNLEGGTYALLFSMASQSIFSDWKKDYDVIIIDTPPLSMAEEALPLMHQSDLNLIVTRRGKTKRNWMPKLNNLLSTYEIPQLYMVLNAKHRKRNAYYYYSNKAPVGWRAAWSSKLFGTISPR